MTHVDVSSTQAASNGRKGKDVQAIAASAHPLPVRARANVKPAPSMTIPKIIPEGVHSVERSMQPLDVDSHATLNQLRDLVVGPTQRLNEARLEELIKIFEEREAELRGALRDVERKNEDLRTSIDQNSVKTLMAFKAEFQAMTAELSEEMKKAVSNLREEIAAARKDAQALVQALGEGADRNMKELEARMDSASTLKVSKLKSEMDVMAESMAQRMVACQREAQTALGRILAGAADEISRTGAASNG